MYSRAVRCELGSHGLSIATMREQIFLHVCVQPYKCIHLCGMNICFYHLLLYPVMLYPNVTCYCTHVCPSVFPDWFVQWMFCLYSEKNTINVYIKERGNVHVCGRLSPTETHPTLVRAQRRVTQVSNGNSTQTHTYRAGRITQLGPKSTDELV